MRQVSVMIMRGLVRMESVAHNRLLAVTLEWGSLDAVLNMLQSAVKVVDVVRRVPSAQWLAVGHKSVF